MLIRSLTDPVHHPSSTLRKKTREANRQRTVEDLGSYPNLSHNLPYRLTQLFCPSTENTAWVRKVRLVGKVQLATKALKFVIPAEAEKPPEERRECESAVNFR